MGHPRSPNWTLDFEPAVFPHLEPTILFFNWSAVSHLKSRDFRFHEPTILFDHWSAVSPTGNDMTRSPNWTLDFEPAVFPHLEPTILFFNWSAVSHLKSRDFRFHEPTILFDHWSAVSPTGNDMTSSSGHVIALDQSGASICHILADFTTHLNGADPFTTLQNRSYNVQTHASNFTRSYMSRNPKILGGFLSKRNSYEVKVF